MTDVKDLIQLAGPGELNAQEWINDLTNINREFDNLMNKRFDKNAGKEYINLRETRTKIDKAYSLIIDRINASILLNGEAGYTDFVKKINERTDYFKNTIATRRGRAAAKKEKS